MSLEQAIEIALENNLDLKVARMNPQIQDYSLQAARATFRPTLSGNFNQNHSSRSRRAARRREHTVSQSQTYSTSLSQSWRSSAPTTRYVHLRPLHEQHRAEPPADVYSGSTR